MVPGDIRQEGVLDTRDEVRRIDLRVVGCLAQRVTHLETGHQLIGTFFPAFSQGVPGFILAAFQFLLRGEVLASGHGQPVIAPGRISAPSGNGPGRGGTPHPGNLDG